MHWGWCPLPPVGLLTAAHCKRWDLRGPLADYPCSHCPGHAPHRTAPHLSSGPDLLGYPDSKDQTRCSSPCFDAPSRPSRAGISPAICITALTDRIHGEWCHSPEPCAGLSPRKSSLKSRLPDIGWSAMWPRSRCVEAPLPFESSLGAPTAQHDTGPCPHLDHDSGVGMTVRQPSSDKRLRHGDGINKRWTGPPPSPPCQRQLVQRRISPLS